MTPEAAKIEGALIGLAAIVELATEKLHDEESTDGTVVVALADVSERLRELAARAGALAEADTQPS